MQWFIMHIACHFVITAAQLSWNPKQAEPAKFIRFDVTQSSLFRLFIGASFSGNTAQFAFAVNLTPICMHVRFLGYGRPICAVS